MSIQGHQNHGIRGSNVTGFVLDNSLVGTSAINGTSNTADVDPTGFGGENSVRFYNLLGSATISNSTLDQGFSKTIGVANDSGTLNRLTITNCTVRESLVTATASDSLFVASTGNATVNFTVNGASIFNATRQFHIDTSAAQTSTMDIQITGGCAFSNTINPVPAGGGLQLGSSGTDSFVTVNIDGNSFRHGTGASPPGINNTGRCLTIGVVSGNSKFDGKITNNTFGVTGIARSGSGDGADAIGVFASGNQGTTRGNGTTHSRFLIQNNVIKRYGQTGIQINARQGNSILDTTVFGNTINEPGGAAQGAFAAIWGNAGTLPADTSRLDIVIGSATVAANKNTMQDSDPSNATDVFLDKNTCAGCASTLNLYRNGSGAPAGQSEAIDAQIVTDNNNPTLNLLAGWTNGSGPTIGTPAGVPPVPPLLFAPGGVDARKPGSVSPVVKTGNLPPAAGIFNVPAVASSTVEAAPQAENPSDLSQPELDRVVAAAIARWSATGLNDAQLATLRGLRFEVAELPDLRLGEADGINIRVDSNAGGNGWFIDANAHSDAFFAVAGGADPGRATNKSGVTDLGDNTRFYTDPAGAPAGRIDLLTAIMHEMGHALGLDDSYLEQDRDSLMYGYLTKGERRLPAKDQARGATPHAGGEMHFLTSPVVIGTLPAGKSVVVTYTVTINVGTTAPTISNQGTVSGSNFSNVLTDDPTVAGGANPTVTQVQQPPVVANIAQSVNEDAVLTFSAAMFDAGFSDPNQAPNAAMDILQSVQITSLPTNGSLNVALNTIIPRASLNTLTYTPNSNYNGADSFGWNGSDGTVFAASGALVNLTVNPVNDVPSFTKGPDQTVLEDAGAQTVPGWATNISPGPANESSQVVDFIVTNNNNPLFSVQPAVSATGQLTYTPALNANGTAIVSVRIHDDGGVLNGGVDTSAIQTFNINVTAVNDAPTLDAIPDPAPIPQDSGLQTVNLSGITEGPANESTQTVTVSAVSNNTGLIPNPTVNYTDPSTTGSLNYTPVAGQSGSAQITVTVMDNGGVLNSGVRHYHAAVHSGRDRSHANTNPNTDSNSDANADTYAESNPNRDAHSNCYSGNTNSDTYSESDPNGDTDANPNSDSDPNADSESDPNSDTDTNRNRESHPNGIAYGDTHGDADCYSFGLAVSDSFPKCDSYSLTVSYSFGLAVSFSVPKCDSYSLTVSYSFGLTVCHSYGLTVCYSYGLTNRHSYSVAVSVTDTFVYALHADLRQRQQ